MPVILEKLNLYFYKLWMLLKPRRKIGLVSFVILTSLVLVVWLLGTSSVHAIDLSIEGLKNLLIDLIFLVAGLFIKLTFFLLKFVIEVAGYNSFIDSSAVIVGWVMVRDVTNMFFVVILLLISFGTILGLEQYEYKKLLVKLLIAAIVVNFSRIICGIIIDIAQVVMITFVNGIAATAGGNLVSMFGIDQIFKLTGSAEGIAQQGSTFLAAVAAIGFSAIMMMTMLTFLFLLLARMLALWILIVLSPFAFVLNVLPQTQKYAGQWWSEFGGNVVAGPIIAFFLWLSFVTVGNGKINNEISAGSTQPLVQDGADVKETSTGITDIMSWAQMANFAIAIGMLLTGAKVAQQLGAAGGSMMGKAGEFGKKVAMAASGLNAARWAGGKALSGGKAAGKFALMKAPLIGGDALQRRGRAIKAWAQYRTVKKGWGPISSTESRLIKAGKRVDTAYATNKDGTKKYGFGKRAMARLGLALFAPTMFREEYTKDKESRAKYAEEQMEHVVSTSKTDIGQEKQFAERDLRRLEETGSKIKSRKMADVAEERSSVDTEIEKEILAGKSLEEIEKSGKYTDRQIFDYKRLESAEKSAAQAEQINATLSAAEQRRLAEQRQKEITSDKGVKREGLASKEKAATQQIESQLAAERELKELRALYSLIKDQGLGEKRQKKLTAKRAELESAKDMMDLQKNKSVMLARAAEYKKPDRLGGPDLLQASLAEQQAHSLELNKLKEVYKSADIGANERGNIAAQLIEKMKEARASGDMESLKSLIKQKDSLHDFSSTQSSYDSVREEEEELRQLGWSESISNENVARRFLSRRLGKIVGAGEENKAEKEYRNLVGEDEYKVRMRQFGSHAKIQQAQGNAGAFVYKEFPNSESGRLTGLTDYEPVTRTGNEIIDQMSGWLKSGFIDTKKMLQAAGDRKLGDQPGSGSVLININEEEAKFNAEALGNYTSQSIASMGKRGFIGDLNGSAIDREALTEQLVAFAAKATNKQAFDALTKNLKDVLTKLKVEQKELDDLWDSLQPSEPKK